MNEGNLSMHACCQSGENNYLSVLQPNSKETTEKYGLEAGLWQVFQNKDPVTGSRKQSCMHLGTEALR